MLTADLRRLAVVAALAVACGWLFGEFILSFAVFAIAYAAWLHDRLAKLLSWIRDRKHHPAPETAGVFEALCLEVDYLRERHKRRKKKLGNYLKQFRQATRALPDGTVVLDKDGAVQWANSAAETYLGVRWPEDAKQRIANLIRTPEILEFINLKDKNASIDIASPMDPMIQLNIRLTPYGNRLRLFVARDVTQLHRVNQIRSDFVANVSHELKTPITVLRGYLENMNARRDECPEPWHTALDQMGDHVARMQGLIDELLMLSELEQEDRISDPEPVAVAALITEIHRQAQPLSGKSEHIFALEVNPELSIYGSRKELYSCIENLVNNAVSYSGARGIIEISWYQDDAGAHLCVKDNGIGVAEEHIPRLTERFYRADPSRSRDHGGTGLGLAIVKHVLVRHGASLHIESELGVGSTFRCDFPPEVIVDTGDDSEKLSDRA